MYDIKRTDPELLQRVHEQCCSIPTSTLENTRARRVEGFVKHKLKLFHYHRHSATMPRSNPSHVSFSSAASASFRIRRLKRANIRFVSLKSDHHKPVSAVELAALLSFWPAECIVVDDTGSVGAIRGKIPAEEETEVKEALNFANNFSAEEIESCQLQHERVWMRSVNEIALQGLISARSKKQLTSTEDYLWTEGRHLSDTSGESLHDPKPDFAFGVCPSTQASAVFTQETLDILKDSPKIHLTYSPSQMEDIIYPALIYEAKSDKNPIVWAENQVAVGATRALGLLRELAHLSESNYRHCVLAVVSAGEEWKFFIAYDDPEDGVVSL